MKIFGFEIRKFEQNNTTVQMIETWCVKWESVVRSYTFGYPHDNVIGFPTKEGAEQYAQELKDARKLLGDHGWSVEVYRQKVPTNAN